MEGRRQVVSDKVQVMLVHWLIMTSQTEAPHTRMRLATTWRRLKVFRSRPSRISIEAYKQTLSIWMEVSGKEHTRTGSQAK